ncbi:MAG TPA: hypothetical protein VF903_02450 [Nitrospirota bacterium]
MSLIFIDYTPLYYTTVAKAAMPPGISGKFVQLRNESDEYLVLSPREFTKYHAGIVERFCFDKGIEGSYDPEKKRFDIYDTAWTIIGGGKFELDAIKNTLRLYDNSQAYGKFDARELLEKIRSLPDFSGYTILIE